MFTKYATALTLLALVASTSASPTPLERRDDQPDGGDCYGAAHGQGFYNGKFNGAAANLLSACSSDVSSGNTDDIWSIKSCVAAATTTGIQETLTWNWCTHLNQGKDFSQNNRPSLNYNIYASIVGDCAWAPGGCPITQQNFVDFVFGTLTDVNTNQWPTYDDAVEWFGLIKDWTKTGDTVPYTNFNDWLHWA